MDDKTRALEELYRDRYTTFRDVLTGVTGNYETAREVVQEAFARALRERSKYRGEGTLEAWVWRIAFRLALRNRRDTRPVAKEVDDIAAPTPAENGDLRAAIRQLSPQRRRVVFLRYFADLSYAEIAVACEISEGTVAATLTQARNELLTMLSEQEVDR